MLVQQRQKENTSLTSESSDSYHAVITRCGSFRVARDRQNRQWLFQRCRSGLKSGKAKWDTIAFCRTQESLLKQWRRHCAGVPLEIPSLAENIKGAPHHE